MSDISEWSRMDGGGIAFERLHKVWFDGVFHQYSYCARHAEVFDRYCFTAFVRCDNHATEAITHVRESRCQRQDSHNFRGNCNVVAGTVFKSRFILAHADLHFTEEAVVDVDHASPGYRGFVNVQPCETTALFGSQF